MGTPEPIQRRRNGKPNLLHGSDTGQQAENPTSTTICAEMGADTDEDGGIEFIDHHEVLNRLGDEPRQDTALTCDRCVSISVSQKEPRSLQPVRKVFKRRIEFATRGLLSRIQCEGAGDFLATNAKTPLEVRKRATGAGHARFQLELPG